MKFLLMQEYENHALKTISPLKCLIIKIELHQLIWENPCCKITVYFPFTDRPVESCDWNL